MTIIALECLEMCAEQLVRNRLQDWTYVLADTEVADRYTIGSGPYGAGYPAERTGTAMLTRYPRH